MFVRSRSHHNANESFSKQRTTKSSISKSQRKSFKDSHGGSFTSSSRRMTEKQMKASKAAAAAAAASGDFSTFSGIPTNLTSPIITLAIGPQARLFAAHESVLSISPFFAAVFRNTAFLEASTKRVSLPEEIPEVFSSVLEYLYKGDYYPRLMHSKRRNAWELEDSKHSQTAGPSPSSTVYHPGADQELLKDTLLYCAADRYDMPELKRLTLRKQGLQSGISCHLILSSARYAYANTPATDSKLRAHYLALIIRSRGIFKRSGTMQAEMERGGGGGMWFDLFVAMCNHMDDISSLKSEKGTPRKL